MKKKRIVVIFACFALIGALFAGAFSASADEPDTALPTVSESADAQAENEGGSVPDERRGTEGETEGEKNLFALLAEEVGKHTADLFAAAACLASFAIMVAYRRGLLPLLRAALEKLHGGVKEIGEQAKAAEGLEKETLARLAATEEGLARTVQLLSDLEAKLPAAEEQKEERRVLTEAVAGQIDLLAEVFLASSLPQYEKDRIAARAEAMKRAVEKRGGADEG